MELKSLQYIWEAGSSTDTLSKLILRATSLPSNISSTSALEKMCFLKLQFSCTEIRCSIKEIWDKFRRNPETPTLQAKFQIELHRLCDASF